MSYFLFPQLNHVKKQYEEKQIINLVILLSPVHISFMYIEFKYVFPVSYNLFYQSKSSIKYAVL